MADCNACIELNGKPTNREPHDGLVSMHTSVGTDGDVITYQCPQCRAQWRRFKTDATLDGAPPHSWTRL